LHEPFFWFCDKFTKKFGNQIISGENVTSFVDSIVDKLFFTVITVNDELNAFKVFETLNARGVRLSATDLLKNYLFSLLSTADSHDIELQRMEELWERIVNQLGNESFHDFLRIFWNSRNKLVRKSDLFKIVRKGVSDRARAFALVRDLDQNAEVYTALRDPQDPMWNPEEKKAIQQLMMFGVRQPLAMLLACHSKFYEKERSAFSRILKSVAVVSFRYNVICNLQTHEQESLYSEIALKVSDQSFDSARQVLDSLHTVYPEDSVFRPAFAEKELRTGNARNKKVLRYILFEIERQKSGQDFDFESAAYSIEHILPENPGQQWTHLSESKQEQLIYRIGNMTPLETKKNGHIGNDSYEKKSLVYETSVFQITSSLTEHYEIWDESKIDSRQKALANLACTVWRVDFG
jgi:hypothetical protein